MSYFNSTKKKLPIIYKQSTPYKTWKKCVTLKYDKLKCAQHPEWIPFLKFWDTLGKIDNYIFKYKGWHMLNWITSLYKCLLS